MDFEGGTGISGTPPLCKGCNHHHFQGTKCGICGHVGQSNLYSRMCEKAKALCSYRVESQPFELTDESEDMSSISTELRRQVFCVDGATDTDDFEGNSRCLVGYVGDLPVWTARWRFVPISGPAAPSSFSSSPSSASAFAALVDRVAVLEDYREQGISAASFQHVIADIHACAAFRGQAVSHVLALVPLDSWLGAKLAARGFNLAERSVQIERGGVPYHHAVLTL